MPSMAASAESPTSRRRSKKRKASETEEAADSPQQKRQKSDSESACDSATIQERAKDKKDKRRKDKKDKKRKDKEERNEEQAIEEKASQNSDVCEASREKSREMKKENEEEEKKEEEEEDETEKKEKKEKKKKKKKEEKEKEEKEEKEKKGKKEKEEDEDEKEKKRKKEEDKKLEAGRADANGEAAVDASEAADCLPKRRTRGRTWTLSVALPGSILDNAPSFDQKTSLAGQVGRACAIFGVDEIVVFDEASRLPLDSDGKIDADAAYSELGGESENSTALMSLLLRYAECPQYLRRRLFPVSRALGRAGLLPPLALPHHLLPGQHCQYREGVVLSESTSTSSSSSSSRRVVVDVGYKEPIEAAVDASVADAYGGVGGPAIGQRVTVFVGRRDNQQKSKKKKKSTTTTTKRVAPPDEPRESRGLNWGFRVRMANGLSGALSDVAKDAAAYDCVLGTSERGESIDELKLPEFNRLLLLFGGVQGLEHSLACDSTLRAKSPAELCKAYVNSCPGQAARTIRTEEALLVTFSAIRPLLWNGDRLKSAV